MSKSANNPNKTEQQAQERQQRYEQRCQAKDEPNIKKSSSSESVNPFNNPSSIIINPTSTSATTTSNSTSNSVITNIADLTVFMEQHQYRAIIDSIPTFSGETRESVNDWIDVLTLKFDILNYDGQQRRRFIPQYLTGNALKWHLAHRETLTTWDDYSVALKIAFPQVISTSRDMNLQKLRNRKQGDKESITEYYTSILELCRSYDPQMKDAQIVDWLKAGIKLNIYERLQGEDYATPQSVLLRAQRLELDNIVFEDRKRENTQLFNNHDQISRAPFLKHQQSLYYPSASTPDITHWHPPPLMATPQQYIPSSPPTVTPLSFPPAHRYPRRPIICYTCRQPGHISPQCPTRPKS